MKKSLFLLMLTASLNAYAANHEVKMLDNGKDGSMVFEPGYVNAKVGDTVTFKAANSGHWVQSKALPDGVADFLSETAKTSRSSSTKKACTSTPARRTA